MSTTRNATVDYARGLGIILVVYGHVARGIVSAGFPLHKEALSVVDSVIYSFHIPLFFCLSGVFFVDSLARRGWGGLILNKIDTVFYPYIVWSLLQGLFEVAMSHFTNGHATVGQVLSLFWVPRAQFWFLYTLFVIAVLAGAIYQRSDLRWTSGVLAIAVLLYIFRLSPIDAYACNLFSQWFVFFALGVSSASLILRLLTQRDLALAIAVAVFVSSQWVFHQTLGLRADSDAPILRLLMACVGIGFIVALGQRLAQCKWSWLAFLGRHSMEIYLAHVIFGSGVRIVLHRFLGITDAGAHLALGMLFGIGMPLVIVIFSRRIGCAWLFSPPQFIRLDRRFRGADFEAVPDPARTLYL
jgi:fucose 4-O-acetylase-like acetyltransferase